MRTILTAVVLVVTAGFAAEARAHCQVPCGIYDDAARVRSMLEDTTTIDKAIHNIRALAGKTDAQSVNQATRWIHTKEVHASRIITTISEYFLAQKIIAADPTKSREWQRYVQVLVDHHAVMRLAMTAKQTVDHQVVTALRTAVDKLWSYWKK